MNIRIVIATLVLGCCAWANNNIQTCTINGNPTTCGLDNVTTGSIDGNDAYKLSLTNVSSGFSDLFIAGINGSKLAQTTGTFQAYVPGGQIGTVSSLVPYMYFTVNPYGTNFGGGDPYALVLVENSGFNNFANDTWYQDGMNSNSTVHIVLNGWTATQAGLTNPQWTTCCSNLPTLSQLLSVIIPANGSEAATTWGALNVYKARVAVGDWGAPGAGPYNAYVGDVNLTATPEPGFYGALALGMGGLFLFVRRKRQA